MELVVRAALIYVFVFLILRVSGKHQFSQLSTFDFVMLLILSEGVSQGLYGSDDFLDGGLSSRGHLRGYRYLAVPSEGLVTSIREDDGRRTDLAGQ